MKKPTKSNVTKLGAVQLKDFHPLDHNDPGTPVAVKMTPTPIPPANTKSGRHPKGNTATTDYGRDSGDRQKMTLSKNSREKNLKKANENAKKAQQNSNMQSTKFDPSGSYTGVPLKSHERPMQDADDL